MKHTHTFTHELTNTSGRYLTDEELHMVTTKIKGTKGWAIASDDETPIKFYSNGSRRAVKNHLSLYIANEITISKNVLNQTLIRIS